jgi:phosphoribosylaminoimidazole-succinocarboxamide synthase
MRRGIDTQDSGLPLTEGKTKRIWASLMPGQVLVESKDDITAGDGARRDQIAGKAELATETTANVFELLQRAGIPTHFVGRSDDRTFRALAVEMIPIELVTRRIAFGSYLKRNPEKEPKSTFDTVEFEMFAKDDANHDPLLQIVDDQVFQYRADSPISSDTIISVTEGSESKFSLTPEQQQRVKELAVETFELLEAAWKDQDVMLVDMKIECGVTEEGEIVVADVIDNDSWRIWPGGDPDQMVDKQLYRDGQSLDYIADKYAWVAAATGQFNAGSK